MASAEATVAKENASRAKVRLDAYERVVRIVESACPPIFGVTGLNALFPRRTLEVLARRPFAGRCELQEGPVDQNP